ncbi:MAG: DUF2167 domain-containing protein [Novosphingobium sp.]|uniref:DUF2167 domain-containing protein n=1 Tax=Novosphingobium sp. TaxID=1874826 RepID=UPI0032BDAA79
MRKMLAAGAALAIVLSAPNVIAQQPVTQAQVQALVRSLKPQHGKITLPAAKASLELGTAYDFYGPADARKVLVDIWGNPPENAVGVLGLVMQAGKSPMGDAWGAIITFEETGYVADDDAAEADYTELMTQMQKGEAEQNEQRKASGYPGIHLVGWAEQPGYNKLNHSVVWARDLKFSDSQIDTLNYDVRTLGRSGVLSVNLVSTMPRLAEVQKAAHEFASHVKFDSGARYEDFDANMDQKAEYGVGGLVAAGVGVAVAKKLGILAILLKFIKPLLFGLIALIAVFRNRIMGLFGRKTDPLEGEE